MNNWIDIVVIVVFTASVVFGGFKGIVKTIFGIVAVIAAFYAAKAHGHLLFPALRALLGDAPLVHPASYALLFLAVMLAVGFLGRLVHHWLKVINFGGINRFGGALFGVLRGWLLVSVFVMLLSFAAFGQMSAWRESVTVPVVGGTLKALFSLPRLNNYRHWLAFDDDNRPAINFPNPATAAAALPGALPPAAGEGGGAEEDDEGGKHMRAVLSRDETLDEINREWVNTSAAGSSESSRQAQAAYEARLEENKSGLQVVADAYCDETEENCPPPSAGSYQNEDAMQTLARVFPWVKELIRGDSAAD